MAPEKDEEEVLVNVSQTKLSLIKSCVRNSHIINSELTYSIWNCLKEFENNFLQFKFNQVQQNC